MSYPDRYAQTEAERGKPMVQIISELLSDHSQSEAAAILNVNPATLWRWMRRAGIKRCYVLDECPSLIVPAPTTNGGQR